MDMIINCEQSLNESFFGHMDGILSFVYILWASVGFFGQQVFWTTGLIIGLLTEV
jgi:hypothetical protein